MSEIPENLKYTDSHEWVREEDGFGVVGITDHAQGELSDVVYVELPAIGKTFKAKEPAAVVESVKAASDIYAPVSGEIVAVNSALGNEPALINQSPYEKAWIFKLKLSDPTELKSLRSAAEYKTKIG